MGANKKWVRDSSQQEASLKTPRMPKKNLIRQKKKDNPSGKECFGV